GEFVQSYPLPGRVPFRCVRYDAATGSMTLDWGFALLLVPVAATSVGTFVVFVAGARSRREDDVIPRRPSQTEVDPGHCRHVDTSAFGGPVDHSDRQAR